MFRLFESKKEKEIRLQNADLNNELARKEAEQKGLPYFGWKYEDDYRK